MKVFLLLCLVGTTLPLICSSATLTLRSQIAVPRVGYAFLSPYSAELYLLSFGPFNAGDLLHVANPLTQPVVTSLYSRFRWPNWIEFNGTNNLIICDGFLLPLHNPGGVYSFDLSTNQLTTLTKASGLEGPFYTMAQHCPSCGPTGAILAGKATDDLTSKESFLTLLSQNPAGLWEETDVVAGIDFAFDSLFNPRTNVTVVWGGSFLKGTLEVVTLLAGKLTGRAVFDPAAGPVFSVLRTDLNNDGTVELLVTTSAGGNGGVVAVYTIPTDSPLNTTGYVKTVIASGFPAPASPGKAAPGIALPLPPSGPNHLVDILLSGDDDGKLYLLSPVNATAWVYKLSTVYSYSGTLGKPAIDSTAKVVYVPAYTSGQLLVFSMSV